MATQTCRLGKRCFAILLCVAVACSFAGVVEAYALGIKSNSPYNYSIKASGTTFNKDYRKKNTSSTIGITPTTKSYYVSPNAYDTTHKTTAHCGARRYINWTGKEKGLSNEIKKHNYSYVKLAFDAGGTKARTCKGEWRPDM